MATDSRLPDSDLTILVDRAAQGAWDSQAQFQGGDTFSELHPMSQNIIREGALPFVFHAGNALPELGYVKRAEAWAEALRIAAAEARIRGDIGKEDGGVEAWTWLDNLADRVESSIERPWHLPAAFEEAAK